MKARFTKWYHSLVGLVCLGEGPQPEAPLASAVAEKLCGAVSSVTALLGHLQAQICLAVKPESSILCPAGMETKVNNPQ